MAEGFANHYGKDVLHAESRGLAPVVSVAPETVATMVEKNVDISRHIPRAFDPYEASTFDIVVNLSGYNLPGGGYPDQRDWVVEDPYRRALAVYQRVCDDIEHRVMRLILELRRGAGER